MPAPGGILTLDLSLTVGWAYGGFGERPVWGHWNLGKMIDGAKVFCRLEDHIDDAILLHKPRHVIYEAPFAPQQQDRAEQGKMLLGLCSIAELNSERNSVLCKHQEVRQARAAVLGRNPDYSDEKNKAKRTKLVKNHIIAWANSRGWDTDQDDEADALLLLAYAVVILDHTKKSHFMRHGDVL